MPIHVTTLSCGTTLLVQPMPNVRSAALSWLVPGGSVDDPANRLGRSAMWSEMLLRGTRSLGSREHADAFDRLGAGRAVENGSFFMRLSTTLMGDRVDAVLPLLTSMVLEPRFDPDALEPSRDLALQALASLADDPQERAMLRARERHFAPPLNRSGLGDEAGLTSMTHADIAEGWKSVQSPRRSIFCAAGAVDPVALAARLDELLSGWHGGASETTIESAAPRGYAHETDETNQVQIILVHDAPPESSPDALLEKVVLSVLSGGMSGRLFSEVREKRALCYSVNAGYRGDRDFGGVTAYVGSKPEQAQESLDVLHAELVRITTPQGAITPEEFARAIVGIKSRLVFSGESTGARAAALGMDWFRLGRTRTLEEMSREVDAVTLDQVNAYAQRRSLGRLTIQTVGPAPLRPPV